MHCGPVHTAALKTDLKKLCERGRRVVAWAVVLSAIGGLLLSSNASARGRLPTPILNAVVRVDDNLQIGIEEAPAVLIKNLGSSSTACSKALDVEQSGGSAQSSWTALYATVKQGDLPASRAIIGALSRSRSDLGELRALFLGRWHDRFAKAIELVPAIGQAQKGIEGLRVAVESFAVAFERWEGDDCIGAQEAITVTDQRIPSALALVNHGMGEMTAALLSRTGR